MSLILDALKKADQERHNTETVPSFDTNYPVEPQATRKPILLWVIVGICVALLLLTVLILSIKPSTSAQPQPNETSLPAIAAASEEVRAGSTREPLVEADSAPSMDPQKIAPPTPPEASASAIEVTTKRAEAPQVTNTEPQAEVTPISADVEALYAQSKPQTPDARRQDPRNRQPTNIRPVTNGIPPKPLQTSSSPQNSIHVAETDTPTAQGARQPSSELQPSSEGQPGLLDSSATEQDATKPTSPPENSISSLVSVKTIKQLPFTSQEAIPTLIYSGHHFKRNGGSYIVINGKTLRERTTISAGIRVEKIFVDGVLLKNASHQFKLSALNSWLNY